MFCDSSIDVCFLFRIVHELNCFYWNCPIRVGARVGGENVGRRGDEQAKQTNEREHSEASREIRTDWYEPFDTSFFAAVSFRCVVPFFNVLRLVTDYHAHRVSKSDYVGEVSPRL